MEKAIPRGHMKKEKVKLARLGPRRWGGEKRGSKVTLEKKVKIRDGGGKKKNLRWSKPR